MKTGCDQPQVIKLLEMLAPSMPGLIYWKDKKSVYLGMNKFALKSVGIKSFSDFIGKTDYDLWPQFAEDIVNHDQQVMKTRQPLHTNEAITMPDGSIKYFIAVKVPLCDDDGDVIGIIGNSIDITAEKRKTLEYLEILAPSIPGHIYWKDRNSVYLGMNQYTLEASGLKSFSDFIGKTDYDLWPQFAEELISHDQTVMQTGTPLHKEESITMPDGNIKYFTAIKVPLRDDEGNIIGIIGNSIDITAEKEAELLRQETEKHRLEAERLKWENEKHEAIQKREVMTKALLDTMYRDDQAVLAQFVDNEIGEEDNEADHYGTIKLTLWETQVLYAMYHKKNAKSAAIYLAKKLNKAVTQDAVNAMINKHLYLKFNLNRQDKLFKKALMLKLIPLFFPEEKKRSTKK